MENTKKVNAHSKVKELAMTDKELVEKIESDVHGKGLEPEYADLMELLRRFKAQGEELEHAKNTMDVMRNRSYDLGEGE
jgi:hypothetical protein